MVWDRRQGKRKTYEMVRKSNNGCLNKKCESSCYQNKFTITIILVDFYKWKIVTTDKWLRPVHRQMVCNDNIFVFNANCVDAF